MQAGPDLRALGLFNFNNRRIYTHELLNKFTNSISAHETPFHAFRTVIQRTYLESGCITSFVSDDAFRTAWFSFTRIQDLGDSFQCELCGPDPKVVIFDGVTASFSNKHQTSTLCPPTLIQPDAPKRSNVRPPVQSTSIVWGKLRASAQKAVRWRLQLRGNKSRLSGIAPEEDDDLGVAVADADADVAAATKHTTKRMNKRDALDADMRAALPKLASELADLDASLSAMFEVFVCSAYEQKEEAVRKPYLELLEHVREHLRASAAAV